jgi:hypothetical protein
MPGGVLISGAQVSTRSFVEPNEIWGDCPVAAACGIPLRVKKEGSRRADLDPSMRSEIAERLRASLVNKGGRPPAEWCLRGKVFFLNCVRGRMLL